MTDNILEYFLEYKRRVLNADVVGHLSPNQKSNWRWKVVLEVQAESAT